MYDHRHDTAVHESAHAVIRIVHRLPFLRVQVYDAQTAMRENALGYLTPLPGGMLSTWQAGFDHAVATLASVHAEHLLFRMHAEETTCADDVALVRERLPMLGVSYEEVFATAKKEVTSHWQAIMRVARTLKRVGTLTYGQVERLLGDANFAAGSL